MQILITGGAGFIGSNLARTAMSDPAITGVRVLDDLSTGTLSNLATIDVDFIEGSVLDTASMSRAAAGMDAIVHLAALPSVPRSIADPVASHHANASGTVAMLEAARTHDVRHVIVASSSSVYGANPTLPKTESEWTRPMSPYAASKLAAESYALAYQASYGIPALAFRFFNVYGPRQRHDHAYAAVIPKFIHAARRGEPVVYYGDGYQSRDFTYVGTVCAVILDALRRRISNPGPVNLAFGTRTDLREIVAELERSLGHPIPARFEAERTGDVRHSMADNSLLLGLFPEIEATPLATGLQATVDWFNADVLTCSG